VGFLFVGIFFVLLMRPAEALINWSIRRGFGVPMVVGLWIATALLFVGVAVMPAGLMPTNAFFIFLAVPFVAFASTFALRDARRAMAGLPPVAHIVPDKFGAGHRVLWIFLALVIGAVAFGEWYFGELRLLALGTSAAALGLLWGGVTGRFPRSFERVFELRHPEQADSKAAP
jgi:hypothetical protein